MSTATIASSIIFGLVLLNGKISFLATLFLGVAYILIYLYRSKQLRKNSHIIFSNRAQQIQISQESIEGIREVQLGSSSNFFLSTYKEAVLPEREAIASNAVLTFTPRYLIEGLAMTALALLILGLEHQGGFTTMIPLLGSFALAANRLLPALQQGFAAIAAVQSNRTLLDHLFKDLNRPINTLLMLQPSAPLPLNHDIHFEKVWFKYQSTQEWVLRDLNFRIPANTTIGFVGSTGSGKSTTADLILGLLRPQQGKILIDGQELSGEKLRTWQKGIAHVPQNIFLRDASITNNIAFGIPSEEIDFDRVREAAYRAKVDEFVQDLPAKYDTFVGERGIRLSGGQRQRIGIARALYHDTNVIVFDEATSALDNLKEREVMEAILGLSHEITIILIAHRLSTVKDCDRIFEFSNGHIVAEGTYDQMLTISTSFRKMASL
jgi:ATP-binding cassette subfamily B protein